MNEKKQKKSSAGEAGKTLRQRRTQKLSDALRENAKRRKNSTRPQKEQQ
jgi:hypothetical protein